MFRNNYGKSIVARLAGVLLAVMLLMGSVVAEGSAQDPFFAQFEGMVWSFCSGAGGWSTDLKIAADGSFTGEFHDSEMGDSAEAYPDGTVYYCAFTGRLSLLGQVDDNTWKVRADEVTQEEPEGKETVEDGCRYISASPYGISAGDEFMLYRPGTSLKDFTDDMKMWAHAWDSGDQAPAELEGWFLYSEKNSSGFVGLQADPGLSVANPWEEVSVERLRELAGTYFSVPEDAQNVVCLWNAAAKMAEMDFSRSGGEYSFRAQPVALDSNQLADISGMYFTWENEEPVKVGWCPGTIGQADTGYGDRAERCLWYDSATGLSYSLSVIAADLDGLDLAAVAEQIILPPAG